MPKTESTLIDRTLNVHRFIVNGRLDTRALGAFLIAEGYIALNLYEDDAECKTKVAFATEPRTGRRVTFFLER